MRIADAAEGVGVAANPAVTFSSAAAAADVVDSVNGLVYDMARATRREWGYWWIRGLASQPQGSATMKEHCKELFVAHTCVLSQNGNGSEHI